MNKKFIEEMHGKLIEEKKKLESELSQFAHRNKKATTTDFDTKMPEYGDGEDENANEVADYSNNLSLEIELEKALRDVNNALKKIEDDSYIVCKYCKTTISEARLRARPTSTSCIACKKTLTQEV